MEYVYQILIALKPKEYKRKDINKPSDTSKIKGSKVFHHSIDRQIDNESIWFIEINGKERIPVDLDTWEKMKIESKDELHAVVILRFVNKSGRNVERYRDLD